MCLQVLRLPRILRLGEAIKYKSIKEEHRKGKEKRIKGDLQGVGYQLLNDLEGYDYKTANKEKERQKIKSFCDNILKSSC